MIFFSTFIKFGRGSRVEKGFLPRLTRSRLLGGWVRCGLSLLFGSPDLPLQRASGNPAGLLPCPAPALPRRLLSGPPDASGRPH